MVNGVNDGEAAGCFRCETSRGAAFSNQTTCHWLVTSVQMNTGTNSWKYRTKTGISADCGRPFDAAAPLTITLCSFTRQHFARGVLPGGLGGPQLRAHYHFTDNTCHPACAFCKRGERMATERELARTRRQICVWVPTKRKKTSAKPIGRGSGRSPASGYAGCIHKEIRHAVAVCMQHCRCLPHSRARA
jgi:hypothetical protein